MIVEAVNVKYFGFVVIVVSGVITLLLRRGCKNRYSCYTSFGNCKGDDLICNLTRKDSKALAVAYAFKVFLDGKLSH